MTVGLVLVSHSAKLAEGLAEVAAQMAPEVALVPAGGLPDGGIGTDYDAVVTAVGQADSGDGVVLLYDLGSARMTAELVVEAQTGPGPAVLAEAPFVEGAVAAVVAAAGGAGRDEVVRAAAAAGAAPAAEPPPRADEQPARATDAESVELVLANEDGLHARPAALLARSLTGIDAEVTVSLGEQRADAHSMMSLMSLGARAGDTITVHAHGAQAAQALRAVKELAERNFDRPRDVCG
ncbi:dihydroxyacetone kinase phosphoryl donor subunit DhaM [Amycolatopsis pigmentata]|uniref:Phosphocarrier protein HPr n=1 Tax=Amycolatopsis pigmentata TaxID=450801 RepID=A0ABW5G419_9PSEU